MTDQKENDDSKRETPQYSSKHSSRAFEPSRLLTQQGGLSDEVIADLEQKDWERKIIARRRELDSTAEELYRGGHISRRLRRILKKPDYEEPYL